VTIAIDEFNELIASIKYVDSLLLQFCIDKKETVEFKLILFVFIVQILIEDISIKEIQFLREVPFM
jgi:hypothetical protein